jgi:hypothetical protein
MNDRYAAALALAGWYLIIPPLTPNGRSIDTNAAYAAWYKTKPPFASKEACENVKARLIALHAHPSSPSEQLRHHGEEAALCVPSDDPRLYFKIGPLSVSNEASAS